MTDTAQTTDTAPDPEPHEWERARRPANADLLALVRGATLLPPTPGRTLVAVAALYGGSAGAEVPLIDEDAIATDVGVKPESVRGILHDLADIGWVERVPTLSEDGRRSVTRFRLHWQAVKR